MAPIFSVWHEAPRSPGGEEKEATSSWGGKVPFPLYHSPPLIFFVVVITISKNFVYFAIYSLIICLLY